MPNIRIKDIPTTASATSSTDFIAIDGATNGTRKLSADSPVFSGNVTVNGGTVGTAASTNLTLAGGSSGASLVLGQGATGRASFNGAQINGSNPFTASLIDVAAVAANVGSGIGFGGKYTGSTDTLWAGIAGLKENATDGEFGGFLSLYSRANGGTMSERLRLTSGGNVLIGGTTDITGSGGLKVFGTTASTSTTTGALQVAGGISSQGNIYAAGVGNFGSNVEVGAAPNVPQGGRSLSTVATTSYGYLEIGSNRADADATAYGALTFSNGSAVDFANKQLAQISVFTDGATAGQRGGKITFGTKPNGGITTLALTIDSSQNATFAGRAIVNSTTASTSTTTGALQVAGGVGVAGALFAGQQVTCSRPFMSTGAITANMTSAGGVGFSGGSANFYSFGADTSTSGGFAFQTVSSNASVNFNALTLAANTGNATFAGNITTSAPTGGAGAWELGVANTVTPTLPNRTITIEIGGTVYYLHAKTTND
jgi:hypothetical protein